MNVDASVMSRSTSDVIETEANKLLQTGKYSAIDMIFPIFDQMTQTVKISSIFYYLAFLYLVFQIGCTSLWMARTSNISSSSSFYTQYSNFQKFAFLYSGESDSQMLTMFLVHTVFFAASLFLLIYQTSYYQKFRRLVRWTLYPTRFFFEVFPMIIAHPLAFLFSKLFIKVSAGQASQLNSLFLVMVAFYYLYFFTTFYFCGSLFSKSAYLGSHPFSTFDFKPFLLQCFANSLILLGFNCFTIFPEWTNLFLVIGHIFLAVMIITNFGHLPFVHRFTNVMSISVTISSIALDIVHILGNKVMTLSPMIPLISFVAVLLISTLITYLVVERSVKKIFLDLSYNRTKNIVEMESDAGDTIIPPEEEKNQRFRDIALDKDEVKGLMYLHYGLEGMCDTFIDISLPKFIITHHNDTQNLMSIVKILVLFPNEYRLLNLLLQTVTRRRDLTFSHRFLIFQVYRIKILRQSSSSSAASEKLTEMKQITKQIESSTRSFFQRTECNTSVLLNLAQTISKGQALWQEALKEYPNSSAHHEAYSHFLVECSTDFEGAVRIKHKSSLIEAGQNFSIDLCFRSMVSCFPGYLKKKVLDVKGNPIKAHGKKKGTQNSQSHSSNPVGSFSTSNEFDARLEEEVGKTIIQQSKMRLALQHSTKERKANNSYRLTSYNIFTLILGIGALSGIFFVYRSYFSERYGATLRSSIANECRYRFSLGTLCVLLNWANHTTPLRYDPMPALGDVLLYGNETESVISTNTTYEDSIMINSIKSRDSYDSFLNELASVASTGENIYTMTKVLLNPTTAITYCRRGVPMIPRLVNLKTAMTYAYITQALLTTTRYDNVSYNYWWNDSLCFCNLISTQSYISTSFRDMRQSLVENQRQAATSVKSQLSLVTIIVPSAYFALSFLLFLIISISFIYEINDLVKSILSLDPQFKQSASQPIKRGGSEDNDIQAAIGSKISSDSKIYVFFIVFFLAFAGISAILVGVMLESQSLNEKFEYLAQWTYMNSVCSPVMVDSLIALFNSIFLSDPDINSSFTNITSQLAWAELWLSLLETVKDNNMKETNGIPSVLGFDTIIDSEILKESCTPKKTNVTFHDMYVCGSTNQMLSFFRDMSIEIRVKLSSYQGKLINEIPVNMLHLVTTHAIPKLQKVDARLDALMMGFVASFESMLLLLYIVGLLLTIVIFGLVLYFIQTLDTAYSAALTLLRRLPPIGIISNNDLVNYLMNRNGKNSETEMTTSRSIIHNSPDGIFCLSLSGIIETVNPAVTHLLGYTPEQMLGQPLTAVLATDEQEKVMNQIGLMKNRQSALSFEDHTICITDNDARLPCNLIILAMTDDSKSSVESFVVIIRDESQLLKQQQEAEEAKKQSEDLLFQILPRDIVVRLNQGEKDISFTVTSASIMFIDIVKFSEYSANLTPQEIMGNLSTLFAAFDESLAKYPLLTKIKLIGDVYMCASGLFSSEDQNANHAEQIIRFGLDALQQLEETNIKLNANLNVRIGVNSGGPLIAGVLGTDKPVFDIIGDPINVASRLCSTDIAGRIQISQGTYDMISQLDFSIEQRGEIFLKGKGKTMAYLIRPSHGFAFQLSSQEMISGSQLSLLKESKSIPDEISVSKPI